MLIAWVFFREHLSRYEVFAALAIILGGALFRLNPGPTRIDSLGAVFLAAACLCWAIDNNLTQKLSVRDPLAIARVKTLSAGTTNVFIGLFIGERLPASTLLPAIAMVGAFGYGISIVLDNIALRKLGAARESAIFATAPFVGAVASIILLGDRPRPVDAISATLMLAGVMALVQARHSHRHRHEPVEHTHAHTHDAHHAHNHHPDDPIGEPHVHPHRHEPIEHEHEHVSDVHHRHEHKS
jgi:drug/metabolite transporter (DMT)-like permease